MHPQTPRKDVERAPSDTQERRGACTLRHPGGAGMQGEQTSGSGPSTGDPRVFVELLPGALESPLRC